MLTLLVSYQFSKVMIRNSKLTDRLAIRLLAEVIGFKETEIAEVLSSFDAYYEPTNPSGGVWFVDDDAGVQGVAYVEPEKMTADGTYNLLFIAVNPSERKKGFVEEARIRDFYAEGCDKIVYWKKL